MKWLETIKIQAASGLESITEREIHMLVHGFKKSFEPQELFEIAVYNHASVSGNFALHLLWSTEFPQTQGSSLGIRIRQTLKAFGLVDHSVWIKK